MKTTQVTWVKMTASLDNPEEKIITCTRCGTERPLSRIASFKFFTELHAKCFESAATPDKTESPPRIHQTGR